MNDRVLVSAGMRSVLLVDDDHFIRNIGSLAVRQIGFDVYEASNVSEAVDVLTSHGRISLVISDVQMPGGSGVELLMRMKQDKSWRSIPIALMTGGPLENLPEGVLVLAKPFQHSQIQCLVVANLGGRCPKMAQGSGFHVLGPCNPSNCNLHVNEWSPIVRLRQSEAC